MCPSCKTVHSYGVIQKFAAILEPQVLLHAHKSSRLVLAPSPIHIILDHVSKIPFIIILYSTGLQGMADRLEDAMEWKIT